MPKFLEERLRQSARKRGLKGKAADRLHSLVDHYVYGAMNNDGAMHGSKETAKGREMDEKHMADHKIRRLEIEVHRGEGGKVTGHTVHHYMMPKKQSKTSAFYEEPEKKAFPFGAGQHDAMVDHIDQHLGGANEADGKEDADA